MVENFVKRKYSENVYSLKNLMLSVYIGITTMRQFQCVLTNYITKNKHDVQWIHLATFCQMSLHIYMAIHTRIQMGRRGTRPHPPGK